MHKTKEDKIGVSAKVDLILLYYMVHEVPDQEILFQELKTILKQDGQIFLVEPPFHVSKKAFEKTLDIAVRSGFTVKDRPKKLFDKAAVLKKS